MIGSTLHGYKFLCRVLHLPSASTIQRSLRRLKTKPGIKRANASIVKLKVNPKAEHNKLIFILMDEMSLRRGYSFDQSSGNIIGFTDDGITRSKLLATSALCVMAVGVTSNWKYPIGYYLTSSTTKSDFLIKVIEDSIKAMESEGFQVLGLTTDQGPNFEKAFRILRTTPTDPCISVNNKKYFVIRDPPHLLKSARNFLEKDDVSVPDYDTKASWRHIVQLHDIDSKNSMRLVPKLTRQHVSGLKFASRMKVKLAANVLSNSVSAALDFSVATGVMDSSVTATSSYCKFFNDLFDVLNSSSSRDKVPLRKPLSKKGNSVEFLDNAVEWLKQLKQLNAGRRNFFINGFIQNINAILLLKKKLDELGVSYLSTRHLCQDPLELFFGKIRLITKFPDAFAFSNNYAKIATASLIKAPTSGNCTVVEDDHHLTDTVRLLQSVS